MLAHITGTVFGVSHRGGTTTGSTPRQWAVNDVKIMVQHGNEADLVQVSYDAMPRDGYPAPTPPVLHEVVDVLVNVSTYRDEPSARFVADWDPALVPTLASV